MDSLDTLVTVSRVLCAPNIICTCTWYVVCLEPPLQKCCLCNIGTSSKIGAECDTCQCLVSGHWSAVWRVVMWSPLVNGAANDAQQIHRRHPAPALGKGCIAAHRGTNMAIMGGSGGHKNGSMLMLIESKNCRRSAFHS